MTRVQRTCLGQHWTFQQQLFVKGAKRRSGGCPWARATWGSCFSPTTVESSRCHQQNSHAWLVHRLNSWKKLFSESRGKKPCGVLQHLTVWRRQSRRSGGQGFKALGAWITFDGHFVKEIAEREVIAWRSFCAIRNLLCDNKVALRRRLRLLSSCVASSMCWCSGSWILTQSQCTHLRAMRDKMVRRTIYVPRYLH